MRVDDFSAFIRKREYHRTLKEIGGDWRSPRHAEFTDPIIGEYRFCNVRRNDDRVTKWILRNYVNHFGSSAYLWFAITVARLFNNEDTLQAIRPHVLPFKPAAMRKELHKRRDTGLKNFNAAYIVSTNGRAMDKVDYIVDVVLAPLWKKRDKLTPALLGTDKLEKAHSILSKEQGLGSFMAAQVLGDLKYNEDDKVWVDFDTFAASGPGSKRGLNRVMLRPVDAPWKEAEFRATLLELREATNSALPGVLPITAQDIQNCLCEFDKYERVRLGEGRPKQKYRPLEKTA